MSTVLSVFLFFLTDGGNEEASLNDVVVLGWAQYS
jgi:hypothetical protein